LGDIEVDPDEDTLTRNRTKSTEGRNRHGRKGAEKAVSPKVGRTNLTNPVETSFLDSPALENA
jgi:hypothetical protein